MTKPDWRDILAAIEAPSDTCDTPVEDGSVVATNNEPKSVTIFFERKGRAGKSATILADFVGVDDDRIKRLASELKRSLGCGGSVSGGEILIQGDRRSDIRQLLTDKGFKVKGA